MLFAAENKRLYVAVIQKAVGKTFVEAEWKKMTTRFLVVGGLVLSCGLCLAKDTPKNRTDFKSLSRQQAAKLITFESAAAPKKDTLAARKIQNRLGVRGVKLGRGKKKAACPLIKTELNGAFNNLLDNFQSLYD